MECRWQRSMKGIDRHSTMDAVNTHDPYNFHIWLINDEGLDDEGHDNFSYLERHLINTRVGRFLENHPFRQMTD